MPSGKACRLTHVCIHIISDASVQLATSVGEEADIPRNSANETALVDTGEDETMSLATRLLMRAIAANATAINATSSLITECQWIRDTDVQDKLSRCPFAPGGDDS
jgi:hypothetical protein